MDAESRQELLQRGIRYEYASIGWNIVEGCVAVGAGVAAGSVALTGFGVDSFIETASAVVVWWRLRQEQLGKDAARVEGAERTTARIAGALLMGLAIYVAVDSGRRLLGHGAHAEESKIGIALTAVSAAVMPLLGAAKLRTANALESGALRADAYETITCAWLSVTTLAGLALNAGFGWWWADPAAGLLLVPLIGREAIEGLRGGCSCHSHVKTSGG